VREAMGKPKEYTTNETRQQGKKSDKTTEDKTRLHEHLHLPSTSTFITNLALTIAYNPFLTICESVTSGHLSNCYDGDYRKDHDVDHRPTQILTAETERSPRFVSLTGSIFVS
jgi:hypothetical protein